MSEIPKHWNAATVEELIDPERKMSYGVLKPGRHVEGGARLLKSNQINHGVLDLTNDYRISHELSNQYKRTVLQGGELLLNVVGSIGRSAVAPSEIAGANVSRAIAVLPIPSDRVRWVHHYFSSPQAQSEMFERKTGIAQPVLNLGQIKQMEVPLPPLPEQRRIVNRIEELFSRLDAGVAALRHAKAQLQRYRQSVLAAAVTGQLTQAWREQHPDTEPAETLLKRILERRREQSDGKGKYKEPVLPDDSSGYALPTSWSLATIDQLQSRVQYGSSTKTNSDDDGVPVLRMSNILDGTLIWDSLKYLPFDHPEFPELLLESGDLLFNRTNSPELVGKTAVFRSQRNPCSFASYLIRVRFLGGVFPEFVAAFINSHFGRAWIKSVVSQQVGQANVNGTKLRGVTLPLPPLAEQHQIVAEVESRTTAIDHLEAELDRQITRSSRLRQSTLAAAFAGNLL